MISNDEYENLAWDEVRYWGGSWKFQMKRQEPGIFPPGVSQLNRFERDEM